jgi:hypothetical protein
MYSTQFGSANRFKHIDLCPTVVLQEQMECSWRLAERINLYGYVVNNAINLADPSGLLFGWGYGNFCGYSRRAACPPGTGPLMPIDAVDAACERHDCCHETWWSCNPLHLSKCSGALCQELLDAWHFGCAQSWGEDKKSACACEIASLQAGALFGGITVLVRLGLPIGIFDSSQSRPTSPRASVVRPGLDAAIKGALE